MIANSLKSITALKHLDLSSNDIAEQLAIVNILKSNSELKKLHIYKNCFKFAAGYVITLNIVKLKNLEILSIDQNMISRCMALWQASDFNIDAKVTRKVLIMYSHDHQSTEVIEIIGSFYKINTLTLCKIYNDHKGEDQPMRMFILDNGSVMLWWSQSNVLKNLGVLRFVSSLKRITTIKLLNISGSELTEVEVDTIATVISENVQLENVHLGSQSLKTIHDDFVALESEKITNNKEISEDEIKRKFMQSFSTSEVDHSPTHKNILSENTSIFSRKLLPKILCALQTITDLKTLDLSGNDISEELAEQLAIVLAKSTKLETLLLRKCSLGNQSVTVISNAKTLKCLDLSCNNITIVLAIVNIFKSNTELKEFYLHQNYLQPIIGSVDVDVVNLKNLLVLSIDQNIISRNMALQLANTYTTANKLNREMFIYNHDYQRTEVIDVRSSLILIILMH